MQRNQGGQYFSAFGNEVEGPPPPRDVFCSFPYEHMIHMREEVLAFGGINYNELSKSEKLFKEIESQPRMKTRKTFYIQLNYLIQLMQTTND